MEYATWKTFVDMRDKITIGPMETVCMRVSCDSE
jgi:hypothetical protein